jgi:hypothetical protein
MIISTPNNMSWIKNEKMRIKDNILNSDDPHFRYPLGNGYGYRISIPAKKLSTDTLLYP